MKGFSKRKIILLTLAFFVVLAVAVSAWFAIEVRRADSLIETLLSDDEAARKAAHDKLVEKKGRIVTSRLIAALGDLDNHNAIWAVLANIGPEAVPQLLKPQPGWKRTIQAG